jgi:predicted TIM-barrel fold metal-dependent hydrolase
LPYLLPMIEGAGVKLVIDHMGRPDRTTGIAGTGFKAVLGAIERGRTGSSYLPPTARARRATTTRASWSASPDRLMWASDCPFVGCEREVTYQQTVDWLIGCVPDAEARGKVLGETALRFYFGESAALPRRATKA